MSASRYAELQGLGARTVTTAEAAATWRVSTSGGTKMLGQLATVGLAEQLRHGVWLLDLAATPESLAPEVTAPWPSYVSHVSALYLHGVIDQVPAEVHLVSAAEPRAIRTSRGTFRLHRMPTMLFGGYVETRGVLLASVEKALFDWAYISVVSGSSGAKLPETEWPRSFRRSSIETWLRKIEIPRIRTMTRSLVERRLG